MLRARSRYSRNFRDPDPVEASKFAGVTGPGTPNLVEKRTVDIPWRGASQFDEIGLITEVVPLGGTESAAWLAARASLEPMYQGVGFLVPLQ